MYSILWISLLCMFMQYDKVDCFSNEAQKRIDKMVETCNGNWVYTSAKTNLNVDKAVHMMIELVS